LKISNKNTLSKSSRFTANGFPIKQALIHLIPEPRVITDMRGGHLALLLKIDRYVQEIKGFIDGL
jgi:hypothetical protein